ncbi:MAG TPA: DUF2007 domain-containing protein [Candidatus Limnocylindrales bacterium]|nr:DUF2007 domain-containing protein [Candidatus Limnocylindrales bacterium]
MGVKGWTIVFKGDRLQAEIVAAALQAEGLRAEVFGDNAYGVGINLTEARLMVPEDQAERARNLIRDAESTPPSEDEEPEPEDV